MAEFKNGMKNDSAKETAKEVAKVERKTEVPKVQVPKVEMPKQETPKEIHKEAPKASVTPPTPKKRVGEIVSKLKDIVIVRDEKGDCYSLPVEKYGKYSMGTNVTF